MNDKKFIVLSSIFFLFFIFGVGSLLFQDPLSTVLKATTATVSETKSLITALPQVCSEGLNPAGKCPDRKIKVDVYIRSDSGDLLAGKTVKLATDLSGVTVSPSDTQITDKNGKAEFILSSSTKGTAHLTAQEQASGKILTQKLSVEFTN